MVKSRQDYKSHKTGKSICPKTAIQAPRQPTPHPNSSQPHKYLQHKGTPQCPRVRGNSPVHLLRGIDFVGLPSRVGVFVEGGLRRRGKWWLWKNLGWRKNLG
ncbi:hypothetical protein K443DRAFT_319133 [Laccaria amethystina LaAM-08-1]|uniref:Unplaced genomic scaffold K443scaffold_21, whole genome shotgun sequence n=1 Tax=Laccaria amethystina LaAM-08-1 TaxID=1095629 RepID=A0A0C9Y725_9AGAR|nr:hypothetical protein K443DRAFT_319133 [Laccaria amethystina LaAM-08-1]